MQNRRVQSDFLRREPFKLLIQDEDTNDNLKEKYGGVSGSFVLEGELLTPSSSEPRPELVFVFVHPNALAMAGHHVCVAGLRFNNDALLIAEKLLLDIGYYIRHLREKLLYQRVALVGWSGGGALAALYQSQAERPSISHTPFGEPVDLSRLVPADFLLLVAAHQGRARFLTESLDPAHYGAAHQHGDAEFPVGIYSPAAPQPPYSAEFLAVYRAAQRRRSERITAWARSVAPSTPFVVHGTMADPRWLDLAISPNERGPSGQCFLGECAAANDTPTGLARFCTAGSWLSQWAEGTSQMDALLQLPRVSAPVLIVSNGADDGVPAEHGAAMFESVRHGDKLHVTIPGALHYFITKSSPPRVQKKQLMQCVQHIGEFLQQRTAIPLDALRQRFSAPVWPPRAGGGVVPQEGRLPAAPRATGFSHLALVSSDMAATTRFYAGVLGFQLVKTIDLPDGGQHFFFDCGDASGGTLAFFWWPSNALPQAPGVASASMKDLDRGDLPRSAPGSMNHVAFSYPESGFSALRKRLRQAGYWVSPLVYHSDLPEGFATSRDDPSVIMISMYTWGPDGEMVEFAASTDRMYPSKVEKRVLDPPKFKSKL